MSAEQAPGWEGAFYFGEVEEVETDWGFDLHLRDDTMAYLQDGRLTVFGWYMNLPPRNRRRRKEKAINYSGYLKHFDIGGNAVGILQEDTGFRRGWERIFKPDELQTEWNGKKYEFGGVLQTLDVEARVSEPLDRKDPEGQKKRLG